MPQGINQPSNQIKLTNVSLVRMKKGKKRFEVPCYKNKVLEWRSGTETDIDNVVQIPNVFYSVSKGQVAPAQDLAKAFGEKASLNDIVLEILKKGDLQVGEKERQAELERVHNEVIDIVAGKLVDPQTKRVYTHGMIEKALDQLSSGTQRPRRPSNAKDAPVGNDSSVAADPENNAGNSEDKAEDKGKGKDRPAWTGVSTSRSAKLQALDAMKALIAHQPIPVARARMRLRVTCPVGLLKQAAKSAPKGGTAQPTGDSEVKATGTVKDLILSYIEEVQNQDVVGDEWHVVGFVEPGAFKPLSEFIGGHTKGRAKAEVLEMAVLHDDG